MAQAVRENLPEHQGRHGSARPLREGAETPRRVPPRPSWKPARVDETVSAIAPPVPDPAVREPSNWFYRAENLLSILALSAMAILPVVEMASRQFHFHGVPGSAVIVQQLTLWVGLLGAALAARSGNVM